MAMRAVTVGLGLGLSAIVADAAISQAQMLAAIAAADASPVVTLHAEGAQLYECKAGGDGKLQWAFREPIATLVLDGKTVGRHYAGPNWEYADGSVVTGKVAASAPATSASDVAWLKLDVVARRGSGTLATVDVVQRINTSGGALSGACDHAGQFRSVPYSADYVFLHKGG